VVSVAGGIAAIGLLSFLLLLQVRAIGRCAYYGPASCVEESAYTYTSSQNYLRLGFLNSCLLQDFCNSADPADHPFVYDHMPAGPDLLLAVLLRATGESYRAVRIILAFAFAVGAWFYLRFCQLILDRLRLGGAGFVVLLIGPWTLVGGMDRLIYNLYPLLAFAPFVGLAAFYRTGKARFLWAAALVALLSSLYLEYSLLSAVIASWVFLYLTGLIPMQRRHVGLILGSIGLGIGLHLVQNILYLGPQVFFRELTMTLGNRTVGVPTQQQLSAFYRALGLVHHGSHAPRLSVLVEVVRENFRMPQRSYFVRLGILGLLLCLRFRLEPSAATAFRLTRGGRTAVWFFLRLGMWVAATVVTPIVLFPAFAQEVNLRGSGANYFYVGLGLYALAAFGVRQVFVTLPISLRLDWARRAVTARLRHSLHLLRAWRAGWPIRCGTAVAAVEGAAVLAAALWCATWASGLARGAVASGKTQLANILALWKADPYADLGDIKQFAGELYITNINTPTVGFFTGSPGYGVCGPDTITAEGTIDKSRCKIAFMRRTDVYDEQTPRYFFFFWSKTLFPGFADDLPSETLLGDNRGGDALIKLMQDRLDTHFIKVYENRLFRVYDLHQKKMTWNDLLQKEDAWKLTCLF
jgi:hypothetical protein